MAPSTPLLLWNNLTESGQLWIKGSEQNKPHLKTEMKVAKKLFDRLANSGVSNKSTYLLCRRTIQMPSGNTLKITKKPITQPYCKVYTHGSDTAGWPLIH